MTRTVVIGAGPVGVFSALALARRGHQVVLVDRDAGPRDGDWRRAGVMQFRHPHYFRPAVRQALLAELPDVWESLLRAGAEPRRLSELPEEMTGLACRRSVFERVLREAVATEPRVAMCLGHADEIVVEAGAVRGVRVDGALIEADLVVSATGRAGRLGDELRGAVEGGSCGFSYVSRMYRARPGRPGCELPSPMPAAGFGYVSVVIPQDADTLSVLISRPTADPALVGIREEAGFTAAAAAIPNLAPWVDPDRFEPITDVLVGGGLTNTYRAQGREPGTPAARGLVFVGDAVCTTNPAAGRGIALGFLGVRQLLTLLDDPSLDSLDVSRAFESWCDAHVRPWWADHVRWDASMLDRFAGHDIDLAERIPSDVICAAAQVLPEIMPNVGLYLGMVAGPDILGPIEGRVRDLLASGWRPAYGGPTVTQLADRVNRANVVASFRPVSIPA